MTDNDPFATRQQNFVIPTPGARAVPQGGQAAAQPAAPRSNDSFERIDLAALDWNAGLNPLVAAAAPLLNLAPQLRAAHHPDPAGLRETLARAIQTFEQRAREAGMLNEHVIGARYALCSFLDETAANTPWGEKIWAQRSLLVQFHNEAWGGEKAFQLLGKLAEQPAQHRNLLELFYIILSLGFEGRFRVLQNGKAQLDAVRERLAQVLQRERGDAPRELSPEWQTTARATKPLRDSVPLWALGAIAALILFAAYMTASWLLNRQSDPTFSTILGLKVPPPPPPKFAPKVPPRLQTYLPEEIRQGRLEVRDLSDRSIVLVHGDGLFGAGSATLSDSFAELLTRIGAAAGKVNGSILVRGHSDNVPIRSARFPSNFHLSQARAEAVASALATQLGSRQKIRAEGAADSEPVVPNDTPAHRALNRRVEIIVFPAAGTN
ncbi:DotU family type VI secretion system protein [Uliginosibacterium flavum]|uniref:DotU family type VI secretion system protein n=1 Tax=Uliginosibacterium flavum TaxID=1396831 RepID=A0ABV2TGA5_9RHOO